MYPWTVPPSRRRHSTRPAVVQRWGWQLRRGLEREERGSAPGARPVRVATAPGARRSGGWRAVAGGGRRGRPARLRFSTGRLATSPPTCARTVRRASADGGGTARALSPRRPPRRLATRYDQCTRNPRGARAVWKRATPVRGPLLFTCAATSLAGAALNSWRPHEKGGYGGRCPDTKPHKGPTWAEADDVGG